MKKVIGIGNALVDILVQIPEDQLLEQFKLPKGSMQLVDHIMSGKILAGTSKLEQSLASGGSAANTIHGLAHLQVPAAYIGKVGDDDFGKFFRDDLSNNNVNPLLKLGKAESGRAIALVSPDSERTFATYLGAAIELHAGDLKSEMFKTYDYLHIEGYLVQNHDLIREALRLAKVNKLQVSLDTASYNVVEANREFLLEMIEKYVNILFANEEEAKALTGYSPEKALDSLSQISDITIVKTGAKGSLIKRGTEIYKVGVIDVKPIDTTGAGDLYASGFIYGLIKGFSLDKCGEIGSILAGNVIEVIGAKMDDDRWKKIEKQIISIK